MMDPAWKLTLPAALLAAAALTGCNSESAADGEAQPPVETTIIVTEPAAEAMAANQEPAGNGSESAAAGTDSAAAPPQTTNPLERIAKDIKPEEFRKAISENIGKLQEEVALITDDATAEAAIPMLNKVRSALSMMATVAPYVPQDVRPELVAVIREYRPQVDQAAETLNENEEVRAKLESRIDGINQQLDRIMAALEPAESEAAADDASASDDAESEAADGGEDQETEPAAEAVETAPTGAVD